MKKTIASKRKILILLLAVAAVLILLPTVLWLVLKPKDKNDEPKIPSYTFCDPYEGDILQAEEYLALPRVISYCESPSGFGMTVPITEENIDTFSVEVRFLADWLQAAIKGDADTCNAGLSEEYRKVNGWFKPFAQQMIYEPVIYANSKPTEKNGETVSVFRLEYKIHRNNGQFRNDIGSDMIRPQYVTLVTDREGNVRINALVSVFDEKLD